MRAADVPAFTAFVQARSSALFRTALLLTGERHLADDLVQSTLEQVCRHWRRVRSADAPEAYARRILVNLANDRWRRLRGRAEIPLDEGIGSDGTGRGAEPYGGTDPYKGLHVRDELMRVLGTLPVGMRTVLVLRYFEDLSDAEIARLMDISASSVRSQAARGLAKLRSTIDPQPARASSGGAA
ncbi:SigE family RNA polymerase sigma factor [Streptomyces sp. TRM66268-LWL]|uniref:SigE family RNA polymerase sigma factor n=1 Tax=Streptomyces polyasparticus TaxID=2767826 RepID=A0ABR7S9S9_9ACTN|nr:SigE family RNA polymerase sigma factor [Streptomyces polyasparticus]MBC9711889.1 SigE family RNA polymerase sigma factor [Streptomyces polyasparticus]